MPIKQKPIRSRSCSKRPTSPPRRKRAVQEISRPGTDRDGVSQLGRRKHRLCQSGIREASGLSAADLGDQGWERAPRRGAGQAERTFPRRRHHRGSDCVGTFKTQRPELEPAIVDIYSNVIENDDGTPCFRLVALVDMTAPKNRSIARSWRIYPRQGHAASRAPAPGQEQPADDHRADSPGDTQQGEPDAKTSRPAGRACRSLAMLYEALSPDHPSRRNRPRRISQPDRLRGDASQAVEGIRLDLKVDTYPVSLNVAMPTGSSSTSC